MTDFPANSGSAEDLLAKVALGDRNAFRALYEATSPHLFAVALRILRKREWAEEALQDAYVQIWNKAGTFRPTAGSAGAWMSTIVRYRALDHLRRKPREEQAEEYHDLPDTQDLVRRLIDTTDLQVCFEDLTAEQQRAVGLAYIEGLSHAELSDRLDSPLGTVKSWVRRGLQALKECLTR